MTGASDKLDVSGLTAAPDGRLHMSAVLNAESPWFDGHFPSQAVFPGVAMLSLVKRAVVEAGAQKGLDLAVAGFTRVRFMQMAQPRQKLTIAVSPPPDETAANLSFEILRDGEAICQGWVQVYREFKGNS